MTAPSFSSFPPSFDSFPDLDPGPSEPRREKESTKHQHNSKHRKSKSKHKEKEHKERKHDRVEQRFDEDVYSNQRIFFSDRKGDPLNVQYGRLHKGDIPRYNNKCALTSLLVCVHSPMMAKTARKYLGFLMNGQYFTEVIKGYK
jgi:hypothetical protein